MSLLRTRARCLTILSTVAVVAACATGRNPGRPDGAEPGGLILTRDRIAASQARDALQAIERLTSHLQIQRTRHGSPPRIRHRGVDSLILDPQVLIVVDGSPVNSAVSHLESIPAESIEFIQLLSGREAAPRFGSAGGNGVILVQTTARTGGDLESRVRAISSS